MLANIHCDATVSVQGGISGFGSISKSIFSNMPFIQGMVEGDCEGQEIHGPLEILITGLSEFAATQSVGFELFPELGRIDLPDFCIGDSPVDLKNLILPSREGYQVYFFTEASGGTPLFNYNVNTGTQETEVVWVSEGPSSTCTGIRIPVVVNVLPKSPQPVVTNGILCTMPGEFDLTASPMDGYELLYYKDNNPFSTPLDTVPPVDLMIPGEYVVWASQCKEGECESARKEIKLWVLDCSLYPEITVSINPNIYAYSFEGEVIYTIELKNTGSLSLTDVYLMESLTQASWNIPQMEPGETLIFVVNYSITS